MTLEEAIAIVRAMAARLSDDDRQALQMVCRAAARGHRPSGMIEAAQHFKNARDTLKKDPSDE